MKKILLLLVAVFMLVLPAVAEAHNVSATATCGSVSFTWSNFGTGANTVQWTVNFTPTLGASSSQGPSNETFTVPASKDGNGVDGQVTVAIPAVNGTVVANSYWTPGETPDNNDDNPPPGKPQTIPVSNCSPATPGLSTSASPSTATVGAALTDVATLTGGNSPTGTITWALYGPGDDSCASGSPLTTTAVTVSGDGSYTSPPLTPTAAGTYHWVATYSGDANNSKLGPTSCSAANETVTLTTPPPTTPPATTPPTPATSTAPAQTPVAGQGVKACVAGTSSLHKQTLKSGGFEAIVTGSKIQKVTFYLDGKKYKTLTKPDTKQGSFEVKIVPSNASFGNHTLKAKVSEKCGAQAASLRYSHPVPNQQVTPKFTG